MERNVPGDGIRAMAPREKMTEAARKVRDICAITPGAPFHRREFGYMEGTLERWREEGMPEDVPLEELFQYDPPGDHGLGGCGWCEAEFRPWFEERVVEDRGEYEVVQDYAGRLTLCFTGRRQGFMPEYLDHPVKDLATWERDVRWRLDPKTPERWEGFEERMVEAKAAAGEVPQALKAVDMSLLDGGAHEIWMKEMKSIREGASGIAESSDITRAREHFSLLSGSLTSVVSRSSSLASISVSSCSSILVTQGHGIFSDAYK